MTEQSAYVRDAVARVAEFVRQWGIPNDKPDDIYGINFDPAVDEMANLYASDLRVILAALEPTRWGRGWATMNDSRVDKVITGGDDTFVGYDGDEIDGIISGFEASGLVVIDPDNSAMRRDLIATTAKFFQPHEGKTMHDSYWLGTQAVNVILGALRDAR